MNAGASFGIGRSASVQQNAGMTSLVDVFLSTIGIFVIIFALQEIAVLTERVPAPFDGAIVCDKDGAYTAHDLQGRSELLDLKDLAKAMKKFAPEGGRFLVGITPGCGAKEVKKGPYASSLAYPMRRKLGLQTDSSGEALHQFEIAPLDREAHSFEAILGRIVPHDD